MIKKGRLKTHNCHLDNTRKYTILYTTITKQHLNISQLFTTVLPHQSPHKTYRLRKNALIMYVLTTLQYWDCWTLARPDFHCKCFRIHIPLNGKKKQIKYNPLEIQFRFYQTRVSHFLLKIKSTLWSESASVESDRNEMAKMLGSKML